MDRNIPILEYYKNNVLVEDKYSLLLLWGVARYLFRGIINLTNYQALAATSVLFGVFFMFLLGFFISRLREYTSIEKLLVFLLIFTQAITCYNFGFANYYAPVPVVIFIYVIAVMLYFRLEAGIGGPLAAGIFAIVVHLGAAFILPSMVFIVLHRFKTRFDSLYAIFTFRSARKSFVALSAVIMLGYASIALLMPYSDSLSEYFVPPFRVTERYGFPLFSIQYIVHLVNMLLLSSPVGIVLFVLYFRKIRETEIFNDGRFALLWIAIAGILHQAFLLPQTIFAWDVYAWTSIGYVLPGVLLFIHFLRNAKRRAYYGTLAGAHCSIYFVSWILLNNNPYASVLNYLDTAEKFDPQLAWCLEMIAEDFRAEDRDEIADLTSVLKNRVSEEKEFLRMSMVYDKLADLDGIQSMVQKYISALQENIKEDPANPDNYYYVISFLEANPLVASDRDKILPAYYSRIIELRPTSIQYLSMAGHYYYRKNDFMSALPLYLKADSLFKNADISPFTTPGKHYTIRLSLVGIYYSLRQYADAISSFEQAIAYGLSNADEKFKSGVSLLIDSYFGLGNTKRAYDLMDLYGKSGIGLEFDRDFISKFDYRINRWEHAALLTRLLKNRNWDKFGHIYHYATEDSVYEEYGQFEAIYQLIGSDGIVPGGFRKFKSNSLFDLLILLKGEKYPDAIELFKNTGSSLGERFHWLLPYIYWLSGDKSKFNSWNRESKGHIITAMKTSAGLRLLQYLWKNNLWPQDVQTAQKYEKHLLPGTPRILSGIDENSQTRTVLEVILKETDDDIISYFTGR